MPRTSKLTPELVPFLLWGHSACRLLQKKDWKAIRLFYIEKSNHQCAHCLQPAKRLLCHERWRYNKHRGVSTLYGFQICCQACSGVIHFGLSCSLGYEKEAIKHLKNMNCCTLREARRMVETAYDRWNKLNEVTAWQVIINEALLQQWAALKVLAC